MTNIQIPRYGETKFEVLAAIADHRATNAFGPTVDELKDTVGLSVRSSVQWHINDLLDLGLLSHVARKHRTLKLTPRGEKLVSVLRDIAEMPDEADD